MALSLMNYFIFDHDQARTAFMIADGIVMAALHYIDRSMKADLKLHEKSAAHEIKQKYEMEKAASRARDGALRKNQKQNKNSGPNTPQKHYNIQQPKRD